jgi:hypothetical protein
VQQASELLDLSPDSVRTLIARGALAASNVAATGGKSRWRITSGDIAPFLAARRNVPQSPGERQSKPKSYQPLHL